MLGRNLTYDTGDVAALGPAAIDDLLDRGDLDDWAPLMEAVRADPFGPVAGKILRVIRAHPMFGTSVLWETWIKRLRAQKRDPLGLAALRRKKGLTQKDLSARLAIGQSDVSKLERRADIRLSTLRAYVEATGGRLVIQAVFDDEPPERIHA